MSRTYLSAKHAVEGIGQARSPDKTSSEWEGGPLARQNGIVNARSHFFQFNMTVAGWLSRPNTD